MAVRAWAHPTAAGQSRLGADTSGPVVTPAERVTRRYCAPVSEPWIAEWQGYTSPRVKRAIRTDEDAERLFEEVDVSGDGPVLIDFYRVSEGGRSLTIAAGGKRSVLNYQESLDPPYYSSRGDTDGEQPTEVFSYGGHESEFRARNLVDKGLAVRALREYVRTGHRPGLVTWEEV